MKSLTRNVTAGLTRSSVSAISRAVSDNGASGGSAETPDFRILVKTDNAGTSTSTQFTLPATGTYTVDWGDGTVEELTGTQTHDYGTAGEYQIKITGGLELIAFNNGGDKDKLLDIQNWGDVEWTSFGSAFYGCSNLDVTASDAPVLSSVTDMSRMFHNCSSLTSLNVSSWNVSSVASMQEMFLGCSSLTSLDVSAWDVGSVTTMFRMFYICSSLTSMDVSTWEVSSVTSVREMFRACSSLASLDVSSWNVSSVTDMYRMFRDCSSLTSLDVSSWNVSSVADMREMFLNTNIGTASYDALLIGWDSLPSLQNNVNFHGGNATYSAGAAATARANIISSYTWTITDGGPA